MTTLTATAVITAVDRASAVFARVGANAKAVGGRFASAAGGVSRFGQAAALSLGMPAAMASAYAARGEFEVDRVARQMQAVGELTDDQRRQLVQRSFDVSSIVGEQAQDLIRAQKELIQGGLDPETTAALTEDIAKVAKTNEMQISDVAEMGINAARGLGMAFDTTAQKVSSIKDALNFMSVVPAASTESVEGLRESLKHAAPVAGMLKIRISELGAALSILADKGFKGEEGGTAFRTILLRGIAPTKQLATAYRAAGIQLDELYKIDETHLRDMGSLRERVLGAGIGGSEEIIDSALKKVGDPSKFDGLYEYQDKLMASLSDALDIGAGDAQSKQILKKVIDQHIFSGIKDFDLPKFMKAISKLPLADFAKVAGIQRTAPARALLDDFQRLEPLIEKFDRLMPGAIDRQFEPLNDGFSISLERIGAALARVRHAIFDSGFGQGIADVFHQLASSLERLSQTNPGVLNAVGAGLAALAVTPAVGFTIMGITAALEGLAAVAASPALVGLAAAGGLAAMFGAFDSTYTEALGPNGGINTGFSPFGDVVSSLKHLGGELSGAFSDAGGAIDNLYGQIKNVLGVNVDGSLLADGFHALAFVIDGIANTIGVVRKAFKESDAIRQRQLEDERNAQPRFGVAPSGGWSQEQQRIRQQWIGEQQPAPTASPAPPPAPSPAALPAPPPQAAGGSWWDSAYRSLPWASPAPPPAPSPAALPAPPPQAAGGSWWDSAYRSLPWASQSEPRQMISDVAPPQKVDVQTYVTGQATVKSDVEVRIIAPPGFGTQVTQSKGGTATVPLNTGKSMPDAGSSGQ